MKILVTIMGLLVTSTASVSAGLWPTGRETVKLVAQPFDLKSVELLDGPYCQAMERTRKYLHDLESERLLYYFRKTAGLPAPSKPMGGWEQRDLRGHTMGHYLSACALMYASTGDEKLKTKADAIVSELAKCQDSYGDGYLSAFPQEFIDRAIACKPVWAPWYTLHKILAGLMDMYVHCGNAQALEMARDMAGWAKSRLDPLDRAAMQAMLDKTEQGGMNEALANLYGLTGEKQWLGFSRRFNQGRYVQPLARKEDRLKGEHANSFIPNIVGTARQYELTGQAKDREIAEFFWDQVVRYRSYCTGGSAEVEHWNSEPGRLAEHLAGNLRKNNHLLANFTQETCCTYNMLKLTRHLFSWNPQIELSKYYERALLNSILASQDPQTGMMLYFAPLGSGRWKFFNTPRDSFWCCTGSGMENHAKYGESIYFHDADAVWVNLFIASQLNWESKGVRIRQETAWPEQADTRLTVEVERPTAFAMRLRIPSWTRLPVVKINSRPIADKVRQGTYLEINRTWAKGDTVDLSMPMHLWAWPMPDDEKLMAVMYGPMVLAAKLNGKALPNNLVYLTSQPFYKRVQMPDEWFAKAPDIVTDDLDPTVWVKPVQGEMLTFRTDGVGNPDDITLVPYHRLWGERYAVYLRVLSPEHQPTQHSENGKEVQW